MWVDTNKAGIDLLGSYLLPNQYDYALCHLLVNYSWRDGWRTLTFPRNLIAPSRNGIEDMPLTPIHRKRFPSHHSFMTMRNELILARIHFPISFSFVQERDPRRHLLVSSE